MDAETDEDRKDEVYSSGEEGSQTVMSERVSNMANSIYSEFERMIQKYDQDVVSGLMPLMVSVLEQLDSAYCDNNEQLLELEMLSDDNEQLITQYEREKQLRKLAEKRYLEIEDQLEADKRNVENNIDGLTHENKALENRVKSYQDHVERLEERISEMKRQYDSLHNRHKEVVHNYMERIEKAERRPTQTDAVQKPTLKIPSIPSANTDLASPVAASESMPDLTSGGQARPPTSPEVELSSSFEKPAQGANENLADSIVSADGIQEQKSDSSIDSQKPTTETPSKEKIDKSACDVSDVNNLPIMSPKDAANSLSPLSKNAMEIIQSTPELMDTELARRAEMQSKLQGTKLAPVDFDDPEADSLYSELSSQEPDKIGEMDMGADIIAMSRELESVMTENKDLVASKNKLSMQKNDLLKRLEELSNEQEILHEELTAMKETKQNLNSRLIESEHELKRSKHEAEKATVALKEASVSAAHRKRFTRVEMARVLMERNQYKERLMELQEAVRWTEMIRASKERNYELQQKRKSSIWKFFSNLFGPSPRRPNPNSVSIRYNSSGEAASPGLRRRNSLSSLNSGSGSNVSGGFGSENFDRQRVNERRERYKQVRAYLNTDLSEGRMQAYGWSLPAKYSAEVAEGGTSLVSVPVPVYCRPLNLNDPGMKIWCAAGVDLSGGEFDSVEELNLNEFKTSMAWIGSSTHSCSKVTIIDANYPQNILDCFVVCTSHLLCLTAVPGVKSSDYDSMSTTGSQSTITASKDSVFSAATDFTDPLGARGTSRDSISSQASDTPTLADVSAVYNDRVDPKIDGNIAASSRHPTMWLGAQSGCVYVHSAVANWSTCIHSIKLKDSVLSIVHVKGRVLVSLADGTVAIFHRTMEGQWNFSNYHLLDLGRPHHSIRCMAMVHNRVWCGYRNKIQVIDPKTMRVEKTFDAHPRRESQVRQLAWIGDGVWVSIRLDSTLRLYNAHTFHHLQDIDIEPYVSKMLGTGKLGFSFVRITSLLLTNDRLWVGTGNGVILSVPLVAARPARDDEDHITTSPGTRGPGGAVRVYSNGSKDGENASGSFMPYCSMVNAQLSFHGHRDSVKFFVAVPSSMKHASATASSSVGTQTQTGSKSASPAGSKNPSPEKRLQDMTLVLSGGEGYVDFRLGDGEEACEEQAGDLISVTIKGQSTNERSHIMVWQVA